MGKIDPEAQRLIDVTRDSFFEGLKFCKVGYRLSDISHAIQVKAESEGYGVIRDFVGHGVGRDMHEEPQIPNYGAPGRGPRLAKGIVFAIEPMITQGDYEVETLLNNWTVVTLDGKLSAHYENTVVITAVSYTHLDVYKRQGLKSAVRDEGNGRRDNKRNRRDGDRRPRRDNDRRRNDRRRDDKPELPKAVNPRKRKAPKEEPAKAAEAQATEAQVDAATEAAPTEE